MYQLNTDDQMVEEKSYLVLESDRCYHSIQVQSELLCYYTGGEVFGLHCLPSFYDHFAEKRVYKTNNLYTGTVWSINAGIIIVLL